MTSCSVTTPQEHLGAIDTSATKNSCQAAEGAPGPEDYLVFCSVRAQPGVLTNATQKYSAQHISINGHGRNPWKSLLIELGHDL